MRNLESKTIKLRLVEVEDADYILSLRRDKRYNSFISKVDDDVSAQKSWIEAYKINEKNQDEFYFIIERTDGTKCGTVRLYDFIKNSFCWGSWILDENKTRFSAIESAFLVYKFGFEVLGFEQSHFEVDKKNKKVISFHNKMGANLVKTDSINDYFVIRPQDLEKNKSKFKKFIG
ncbi:GNAT family N-acetyltransferase [Vibrio sp. F74]|uniref:GNAT family N-acetyltransferase n=1 Tax=Vibrio sp. F74 TaxID=700020 RepID=UPI0035F5454C